MVQLVILSALATMVAVTRLSPTSSELQASFAAAQKFYSSGAYDQAIAKYEWIAGSESRFLDAEAVAVTVGDVTAPLQEVAQYQTGNAHFKMGEEALNRGAQARDSDAQAEHLDVATRQFEAAARFFLRTEEISRTPDLKALARSRAVESWYRMKDYPRTIDGARILIQRYPDSKYVINAMYDIGWAYYDTGEYAQSIDAFEQLVGRFASGYRVERALFQLGEAHFKLERYSEAIPRYQRLVDSQRIGQMTEREILQMKREKIAGLVDETAVELAAKALLRIGVCYEKIGHYTQAAEAFRVVATQFADERRLAEDAYLREADMHCNRGDFDACIGVYRQAIQAQQDQFSKARLQLLLANRYFELDEYEDAVREYNHYRDLYAMSAARAGLSVEGVGLQIARAWFREAERSPSEERLDYHRRAEAELRQTLASYPGSDYDIELRFNLALALQMQNKDAEGMEEVLDLFRSVSEAEDSGGYRKSAMFQMARILHSLARYDKAVAVYRRLVDEFGDDPELDIAHFELGVVLREAGDWQRAVTSFLEVRLGADLYSRSRQEVGQLLLQNDDPQRAIRVLDEGLKAVGPERPESAALSRYLLGASYSSQGDHEAALPHFDTAVAGAGDDIHERALYGRGVTLFKLGRMEEAVRDLDQEWTDPQLRASAPRLLATAYTSLGRLDDALALYRGRIEQVETPLEQAELYLAQAEISFRRRSFADAIEACEAIRRLDFEEESLPDRRPYYVEEKALYLLADANIQRKEAKAAEAAVSAGLGEYPGGYYTPDFLLLGGLAALQLEHNDLAATRLTQLVERYPEHKDTGYARYYLGFAYHNQTLFSKAVDHFAQVVERFPRLDVAADALFRTGECQFNLKQFEAARQTYRKVIADYPASAVVEDALYNIAWCTMNQTTPAGKSAQQSAEVAEAFSAYIEHYPQGRHAATARYTLAEMSFNAGNYHDAHDLFSRIVVDHEGAPAAQAAAAALPQLREAIAYEQYSAAMELFNEGVEEGDEANLRASVAPLEKVWQLYPETPGGVAAKVNVGVCLLRLEEWEKAVAVFQEILAEGEKGNEGVTANVLQFVQRRRDSIVRKHL